MNAGRGSRRPGRARTDVARAAASTRPLLRLQDYGEPRRIGAETVGTAGDRWVQPFLEANATAFTRLAVRPSVISERGRVQVALTPGSHVGAMPLLNPSTRRVAAGLLVEPRFRWPALGSVLGGIGFAVEPSLDGGRLVPGSAREVPPWVLAGPVIQRLAAFLKHRRRGFVERSETRASPRGRVDWTRWTTRHVPEGQWSSFPCRFPDPDSDPELLAGIRWTLGRIETQLTAITPGPVGRRLLAQASELRKDVGAGPERRPANRWLIGHDRSDWTRLAIEAMGWVVEERGLGGDRTLDGLAWSLEVEALWEAWVCAFAGRLSPFLGLSASQFRSARKALQWEGPVHSMGSLAPDVCLRNDRRQVWLDAKYKRHLDLLSRSGWERVSDEIRAAHRADLHQALAYASLADLPRVDTVLVYPQQSDQAMRAPTVARVATGRRLVRVILASLPFGFRSQQQEDAALATFRDVLAA